MRLIQTTTLKENEQTIQNFEKYLISEDLSPETVRGYTLDLNTFNHWLFEVHHLNIALENVKIEDLMGFGKWQFHEGKQMKSTINRKIQSLKRFYRWLEQECGLAKDPSRKLKFLKLRKETQPKSLSRKECHALISTAGKTQHGLAKRNLALVHLMLEAGLRVGEVGKLQVRDLKLSYRNGEVFIRDGKGGLSRFVPLNKTLRRLLQDYLGDRLEHADGPVFESKRGSALAVRSIEQTVKTLGLRAGIKSTLTPHMLRHTFAINYLKAHPGALDKLSQLLGHSSLDTTSIYTKVSKGEHSDDLEEMPFNYEA